MDLRCSFRQTHIRTMKNNDKIRGLIVWVGKIYPSDFEVDNVTATPPVYWKHKVVVGSASGATKAGESANNWRKVKHGTETGSVPRCGRRLSLGHQRRQEQHWKNDEYGDTILFYLASFGPTPDGMTSKMNWRNHFQKIQLSLSATGKVFQFSPFLNIQLPPCHWLPFANSSRCLHWNCDRQLWVQNQHSWLQLTQNPQFQHLVWPGGPITF